MHVRTLSPVRAGEELMVVYPPMTPNATTRAHCTPTPEFSIHAPFAGAVMRVRTSSPVKAGEELTVACITLYEHPPPQKPQP